MDLDIELDLNEVERRLGIPIEKLIRLAAKGKLTIVVMADDWPVRTENGTAETISGPVDLLAEDLQRSYIADFTRVRKVIRPDDNETVTLDPPVEVPRGMHFVTTEEFRQFKIKIGHALSHGEDIPPYLNPNHKWHSPELAIAVEAWMAHFADASFEPGNKTAKEHIGRWLMAEKPDLSGNAKERIATLVNPKTEKLGGVRSTLAK